MCTSICFRKPLIIAFPVDSDSYLKNLFHLGYLFFQIPFKIAYDDEKHTFTVRISHLRQAISLLRVACTLFQMLIINKFSPIPGPMKVFMSVFMVGRYFITIVYTVVMNLSRTRVQVVDLMNLMNDSIHRKNYAQESSRVVDVNPKGKQRKLLQFYFHNIFLAGIVLYTSVGGWMSTGYKSGIRTIWNIFADALYSTGKVNRYSEMCWWMKLGGIGVLFIEVDVAFVFVSAIVSVFLAASTLQQISKHFIDNLESSQKYCVVSFNEITLNIRRVRNVFSIVSAIFSQLTFLVLFCLSTGTCVMTVLAFTDAQHSFPVVTACFEFYYFSIMKSAADAALKLRKLRKLFQFSSSQGIGQCSLQRTLILFELGSSSIGLTVSDVFVVTYAFITSLMVSMLSNATIVLQSLDYLKKAFPPTPPTED